MTRARTPRPHEVTAARRDPRLLRALRDRQDDAAWRTRGACRSVDPETFFPAPSEPAEAAVALCRSCVVQGACLAWALEAGDCHGVWGATTPRERRAMLVAWRGATPPVPPGDRPVLTQVVELAPVVLAAASRSTLTTAEFDLHDQGERAEAAVPRQRTQAPRTQAEILAF